MAPSTPLGRIGPSFSISLLLITIICFCGLASATTPRGITRRQSPRLQQCVVDCTPTTDAMDSFCQKSDELRLEQLRDCAIKTCGGNDEEVKQVVAALKVGLCNIAQGINTVSSVDIASVTDLVTDTETISRPTPTTTMNSTTPASITPTASVNISNDNNSTGTTKGKKKSSVSVPIVVAIAVGGTALFGMCVGLWYLISCLKKRRRKQREQMSVGSKGFDKSSMSDRDSVSKHRIPLSSAGRKEIERGFPWMFDEESNSSTANLHNTGAMGKSRPPPIATKFPPSVSQRSQGGAGGRSSGEASPVSPVSPLSQHTNFDVHTNFDERRNKAISTVSSMKPERTHLDFYNVSSPPLPTPASAISSRHPSTHLPNKKKTVNLTIGPVAASRPNSEYPPEPVSPPSRHPSGKSVGVRSEVSAIGEEHFAWEGCREIIKKYEEQQGQGQPSSPEVARRLSGLSQFNFGFGEAQSSSDGESRRESSYYGWAPDLSAIGHLDMPSGQNKDKHLSGSSSVYSSHQMTPPLPMTREPGPSTPEMFFGRIPPSYTPPPPPRPVAAENSLVGGSGSGNRQGAKKDSRSKRR